MKGDIAFAGFLLTADEWQALDRETRAQLVETVTRRFPTGTEAPVYISGGSIVRESVREAAPIERSGGARLAEGSGPLATDDYIDLFED